MSFLLELADTIANLPLPIISEVKTCEGCGHYKNNDCALCSCFCINNPYRPYHTDYSIPPFPATEGATQRPF